jgi:aspartate kinase
VPDRAGIAAKVFSSVSKKGVNVEMIVQNVSHAGLTDISFTVSRSQLFKALAGAKEVAKQIRAGGVTSDESIAHISIVGSGMRSHEGVAAKMFETLARKKISIQMISTSDISISCIISAKEADRAVRALHKAFMLGA